jgi:hypothetical protein
VGAEAREPITERDGRVCRPGRFCGKCAEPLKRKEMLKAAEPSVRKHIERKDLREFSAGRYGSGIPEDLQEAAC